VPPRPPPGDSPPLWSDAVLATDDGSVTLYSPRFQQTFRSRHGARSEAQVVFVENSGVAARLAARRPTRVLEVGLGAATNFALSAALALAHDTPLAYQVWEIEPLPSAAWRLAQLDALAPAAFVAALLGARERWGEMGAGRYHFHCHTITLEVVVAAIAELGPADTDARFDAIYLDPFSPEANPEAWTPEVLRRLAAHLAPSGRLVSYSVRGDVRRALTAAGLRVQKVPGPAGGKREVLCAERPGAVDGDAG
jgi:tRNA U34 5-methylaminomethyl-2-thiouridine-forming methyltransferase MnmC